VKKLTISNSLPFGLAKLKKDPHLNYPRAAFLCVILFWNLFAVILF